MIMGGKPQRPLRKQSQVNRMCLLQIYNEYQRSSHPCTVTPNTTLMALCNSPGSTTVLYSTVMRAENVQHYAATGAAPVPFLEEGSANTQHAEPDVLVA